MAQGMEKKVNQLKLLGKEALITRAQQLLFQKYPEIEISPEDYIYTVWAKKKELKVEMHREFPFYPLHVEYDKLIFDLTIDVVNDVVMPLDLQNNEQIYVPDSSDRKKVEFVKKHFTFPTGFNYAIHELPSTYRIHLENEVAFGQYEIHKESGRPVGSPLEGSYVPPPMLEVDDADPWVEIEN